jgi:hypothetical protein
MYCQQKDCVTLEKYSSLMNYILGLKALVEASVLAIQYQ